MKRLAITIMFGVPLFVLFLVGVSCGLLSQFFDWVDGKCRDWFESIWHG